MKGRYFYEKLSVPGFREGLAYYQQAVKLDPGYAPAYVGLAASYKELGVWAALPPREAAAHASEAVEKALALDDASGDAHAVHGHIRFLWDWDWAPCNEKFAGSELHLLREYHLTRINLMPIVASLCPHSQEARLQVARLRDRT